MRNDRPTSPPPDGPGPLAIRIAGNGGPPRLILSGELDVSTHEMVVSRILALAEAGAPAVLVDLSETTFIDSAGLRSLIEARRAMSRSAQILAIVDPSPAAQRVIELSGVVDFFEL